MTDNFNDNDNYQADELESQNTSSQSFEHDSSTPISSEYKSDSQSFAFKSEPPKTAGSKKLSAIIIKGAFAAICIVLLLVGVVQVVKFLKDSKNELIEFSADPARNVSRNAVDSDEAASDDKELPSLIELAARDDARPVPDIVDSIMPSVVGVASNFEYKSQSLLNMWGGWSLEPQTQQVRSTGTGFIITDDGYIVTNAHVVYDEDYGEAVEVTVLFSDETEHEASIIAFDPETDIAVLKVDETKLTPAILGDSDELRVGELVIAVGNPLGFDLFGTVTCGIVSALNRKININEKKMNLIQTDAAINNGNSGGPLLNSCGQVIGINSAKMSSSYSNGSATIEGLCFAIPIKEAKSIIDDLINYKYVTGRPQLGILLTRDITAAQSRYWNIPVGVLVASLQDDGAAERAGIEVGDVIIDIEGCAVSNTQEMNEVKNKFKAGDEITVTVSRNGQDIRVKLKLQEQKPYNNNRYPVESDTDN